MCELVVISVPFYTANDNDNFSASFTRKTREKFCESEKQSTGLKRISPDEIHR
jgi:hypothetical protein